MAQLEKLDSFIKETLRNNGHLTHEYLSFPRWYRVLRFKQTVTFQQIARKTITLSDGIEVAEGYTLFSPANAIKVDPELYPDPETFDSLRFYKLRHPSTENEKKFQLTSIIKEQMQFWTGRHGCPGRWIASYQVELILAHLLDKYVLKLRKSEGRPRIILFQTNQFPDPQGEIFFKNRK